MRLRFLPPSGVGSTVKLCRTNFLYYTAISTFVVSTELDVYRQIIPDCISLMMQCCKFLQHFYSVSITVMEPRLDDRRENLFSRF